MRENPTPTHRTFLSFGELNSGPHLFTEFAALPDLPDPNFLRHQHALNHQLSMTPMDILRPTLAVGSTTLSHW